MQQEFPPKIDPNPLGLFLRPSLIENTWHIHVVHFNGHWQRSALMTYFALDMLKDELRRLVYQDYSLAMIIFLHSINFLSSFHEQVVELVSCSLSSNLSPIM
jgi:hypothetical protein